MEKLLNSRRLLIELHICVMKIYYDHRLLTPVDLFKKFTQENNVDLSFAKTAHLSNKTYKGDDYANGKFL